MRTNGKSSVFIMGVGVALFMICLARQSLAQCGGTANDYRLYANGRGWITGFGTEGEAYAQGRGPNDDPDGDGLKNDPEFLGWQTSVNGVAEGYSYHTGDGLTTCGPDFDSPDTDGDGLSDWAESKSGTNPRSGDTDVDGMGDAWEVHVGLDPCDDGTVAPLNDPDEDPDGDGISNRDEMKTISDAPTTWGSSPGASQHSMVIPFTNSACPYTFPLNFDSDGDELIDSYEHRTCKHSNLKANEKNDPSEDYDLDGLSNFREQCVHPLLAQFWSNSGFPDSAEIDLDDGKLKMKYSRSGDGLTHAPARKGLMTPGYMCLAQYDEGGNASPAGLDVPYDLGPGVVKWGLPYSLRRWTRPNNPDTDGDTLPDGWEVESGINPLRGGNLAEWGYADPSGPLGDPDSDGKSNLEEYYGQDGYRINNITGTGDETSPWIARNLNGSYNDSFQAGVGQWTYAFKNGQAPEQYLYMYDVSYTASFDPTAAYGLIGFFDSVAFAAGNYVPVPGVPAVPYVDDRLDSTFSRFNPFATTMAGLVFRDAPGSEDGLFTPGLDDAWLDRDGDGVFQFANDVIIVDNTGLSGGEQMTALITANVPQKWPENGLDTDDDGYPDYLEIEKDVQKGKYPSSPVNPLSPFEPKAMAVHTGAGIEVSPTNRALATDPDNVNFGTGPNRRFFSRDFTVETWVYLEGASTDDFQGSFIRGCVRIGGLYNVDAYNLGVKAFVSEAGVTNNAVPYISYQTGGGKEYLLSAERTIPMNRWVHLAGVFTHDNNGLSLYIDGLLEQTAEMLEETSGRWGITAGGEVLLAQDLPGAGISFASNLWMDEVRIWGIPRSSDEVANNRANLVNPFQEPGYDKYPELYTISILSNYTYTIAPQIVTNWIDTNNYVVATNYVQVTNVTISFVTNHPINALFCYFPFDDGGRTAQDFTMRAANSLAGYDYPADSDLPAAPKDDLFFGDSLFTLEPYHVSALGTNVLFEFDNTRKAPVIGMLDPEQGGLDSDGDKLPDGWEVIMEFNAFRKMTPAHKVLNGYDPLWATTTGTVFDAESDPDGDGLPTIYEYWARTNPRQKDTDGNGKLDINEDFDGDGLNNLLEVQLGSRPDLADTDDDQYPDGEEQAASTKPNDSLSPARSIAALFDGSEGSFLDIPSRSDMRLPNYTIEARVLPSAALTNLLADGDGASILRKVDQVTENDLMACNYELRIVRRGNHFTPEFRYISVERNGNGTISSVSGNPASQQLDRISLDMFENLGGGYVDLAVTYNYTNGTMKLYMDGRLVGSSSIATNRPPMTGKGPRSFIRMGERFAGAMDHVRIWDTDLSQTEITARRRLHYNGSVSNLVANFRFDDGGFPLHAIYEAVTAIQAAPPAAPQASSRYVVDAGGSGAWTGKDGKIAEFDGVEWSFVTPVDYGQVRVIGASWYQYRKASGVWTRVSDVLPSARYSSKPAVPRPGDTWMNSGRIVTYDSGIIFTSPATYACAFVQGGMAYGSAQTGDFAYYAEFDEYWRCVNGATDTWQRWGSNPRWLGNAMAIVKKAYATSAAMLADRKSNNTFVGDGFLVEGPTPYVYVFNGADAVNQITSYTRLNIYDGNRVLNAGTAQVVDYKGTAFVTVADAITDGGDLYIVVNSEGVTYKSDGVAWVRWGFIPTFQEFTVTNGWMTQWSKSALVYGNVKAGSEGESNSGGGGGGDTIVDPTDTDGDGLPDEWEIQYFGNLDQGPDDDPDGDGLTNMYEYLAGTNPTITHSNGSGNLNDNLYDSDGDGLSNGEEQQHRTNPGLADSDDDGVSDYSELASILTYPHGSAWTPPTSPLYSMGSYSPTGYSFNITCDKFPTDGVVVPDGAIDNPSTAMTDWTIETWFFSDNINMQQGVLIGKYVEGKCAFELGIDNGQPYAEFDYQQGVSTNTKRVIADAGTLSNLEWAHLSASWDSSARSLSLYVNGTILYREAWPEESWTPVNGTGVVSLAITAGAGFTGKTYMDNVRIWSTARSLPENDASRMLLLDAASASGLLRSFRFDDGGQTVEDFAHPLNRVTDSTSRSYVLNPATYGIKYGAGGLIAWLSREVPPTAFYDEQLADGEYLPDWWKSLYQITDPNADGDGDGLSNLYEFMGKTDPTKKYSYGSTLDAQRLGTPALLTLLQEQTYFSDPRYEDTDGDGTSDADEIFGNPVRDMCDWPVSDPATALQNNNVPSNPQMNRYSVQTGTGQYLTLQTNGTPGKYALEDWTLEAWIFPQTVQDGSIIWRQVQTAAAGGELVNYHLGVEASSGFLYPYAAYIGTDHTGAVQPETRVGGAADAAYFGDYLVLTGQWAHVAARFNSESNLLTLFVNGMPVADNSRLLAASRKPSPIGGKTPADLRIGENFAGLVDEVKIWGAALDNIALYNNYRATGSGKAGGYDIGENGAPTNSSIGWIGSVEDANDADIEYAENQMLVKFNPSLSSKARMALMQHLGTRSLRHYDFIGVDLVEVQDGTPLQDKLTDFQANNGVEYAELNLRRQMSRLPNDALFGSLWGLNNTGQSGGIPGADISASEAWDKTIGSRDVVVAVIDSGVDYEHTDLAANMWTNEDEVPDNGIDDDNNGFVDDYYGYDFYNEDGDPMDDNSHGTHCAGTIGGVGNNGIGVAGVNWNVRIMALKFLSAGGGGFVSDELRAIEYALKMGAKISNNSYGGLGFLQSEYDAIKAAGEQGHLFVAAAGNYGIDMDEYPWPFTPAGYDLPNIISVGASDHNDAVPFWSNYGAESCDLMAPGSSILSTIPGDSYGTKSGTSMACPHVAGVAALVKSMNDAMGYADIKAAIMNGVDAVNGMEGKSVTGGRLNAAKALSGMGGLVAYFRMDDGGQLGGGSYAQDMAVANDNVFGWRSSALLAGGSVYVDSNYAQMTGDSDFDGMPDWFETAYKVDDANADEDSDGLKNLYEYYAGTDPLQVMTFGVENDAVLDSDGDTLDNAREQLIKSHPGLPDTDDDNIPDGQEVANYSSPVHSLFPTNSMAMALSGDEFPIVLPDQPRLALSASWTVEGWVNPDTADADGGVLVGRYVCDDGVNYELGLLPSNGALYAYGWVAKDSDNWALVAQSTGTVAVAPAKWTHLALVYDVNSNKLLSLYVNGKLEASKAISSFKPASMEVGRSYGVIGSDLAGMVDEIRIWSVARSASNILASMYPALVGNEGGLTAYYRFDDDTSFMVDPFTGTSRGTDMNRYSVGQIQDFDSLFERDWGTDWFNGATILSSNAHFVANTTLPLIEEDSDNDGMPDWWEYYYFGDLNETPDGDFDGDGLSNGAEYRAGTDPTNESSFGNGKDSGIDSDGDGLPNQQEETHYKTNPGKFDTDNDGVGDGLEVDKMTDPTHPMSVFHPLKKYRNTAIPRSLDLAAVVQGGIELPDRERFSFMSTNGWTVELWFQMGSDLNGTFFEYQGTDGDNVRFSLYNGTPYGQVFKANGTTRVEVGGPMFNGDNAVPLPRGRWVHLALVWTPGDHSIDIYRNGSLLVAQQTDYTMYNESGRAFMGLNFSDGYLDEFRVWNRVRSAEEIADWYDKFYPAPGYVGQYEPVMPATYHPARYNDLFYSVGAHDKAWMEAYVPSYEYGQPLVAYYRFDDAGSHIEDFACLNQEAYYLTAPVSSNEAYRATGLDDADGDGLPEWWVEMHGLNAYPKDNNTGPYHVTQPGKVTDYPVTFSRGWGTDDGTKGINTRLYYYWQTTLTTNDEPIIMYNVWKDIDPEPTTNDTIRDTYWGQGQYNETNDVQMYADANDWFTPDQTYGFNHDIMYNDSNGSKLYDSNEDIWLNMPGGDSGLYDQAPVVGIWYYRDFVVYGSVGGGGVSWWEDEKYLSTKDDSVSYDGHYSAFFRYVYLKDDIVSASMVLKLFQVEQYNLYVNGESYQPDNDENFVQLASLLKRGRNSIYLRTNNGTNVYLIEGPVNYNATYDRPLTGMKFDMSLTVNGDDVIKRGDYSVADPAAVWYGSAWSDYYEQEVGSVTPHPDTNGIGHLNADFGIKNDEDGDTLNNYYEYKVLTNPRSDVSSNNPPDTLADFDDDGLVNIDEFTSNSDPTLPDTDDDGLGDAYEKEQMFFSPADSMSPYIQRALSFTNGTIDDYMECPVQPRFNLNSFAVEAWVAPMDAMKGKGGYILRRLRADGSENGTFALGLDANMRPYAKFVTSTTSVQVAGGVLPTAPSQMLITNWSHVACTYEASTRDLKLYVNGEQVDRELNAAVPTFNYLTWPVQRIGEQFLGAIDEVRIWNTAQAPNWKTAPSGTETNLIAYYRFDDSTAQSPSASGKRWTINDDQYGQVEDFVQRTEFLSDWESRWIHAGSLNGYVDYVLNKYLSILRMDGDSDGDGMPDDWEQQYPTVLNPMLYDANLDSDHDAWDNLSEYLNGTDPDDAGLYPHPSLDVLLLAKESQLSGTITLWVYDNIDMAGTPIAKTKLGIANVSRSQDNVYTLTANDEKRRDYSGNIPKTGSRTIQAGSVRITFSDPFNPFQMTDSGDGTLTGPNEATGTINYDNGDWYVNVSSNRLNEGATIQLAWQEIVGATYPLEITAQTFDYGKLRQGDNWLFVFVDADGDGTYDAGEYAGKPDVQPINLRNGSLTGVRVGLQRQVQGYPRISWDAVAGVSTYQLVINSAGGTRIFSKWVERTFVTECDFQAAGIFGMPYNSGYFWYVNTSNSAPHVSSGSFSMSYPSSLPAPEAQSPAGTFVASGHPTFRFNINTNATLYGFELMNSSGTVIWSLPQMVMPYINGSGTAEISPYLFYGCETLTAGTYRWRIRAFNPVTGWSAWSAQASFTVSLSEASGGPFAVRGDVFYFGKAKDVNVVVAASKSDGFSGDMYQLTRVPKVVATNAPLSASVTPYALRALPSGHYYIVAFIDLNGNFRWDHFESYGYLTSGDEEYKPALIDVTKSRTAMNIKIHDVDTDSDGLPDAWEWVNFGVLTRAGLGGVRGYTDSDGDGLNDLEEYNESAVDSDPTLADTDGDGIKDGDEVLSVGSDPKLADTDGDGLPDGVEIRVDVKGNPGVKDTDSDGVPDGIEFEFKAALNNADGDGDGYMDILEIVGGFAPNDRTSHPNSTSLFEFWRAGLSGGRITMAFDVNVDAFPQTRVLTLKKAVRVILQYRDGFEGVWTDVPSVVQSLSNSTQGALSDSLRDGDGVRIYRLRWELEE